MANRKTLDEDSDEATTKTAGLIELGITIIALGLLPL